MRRRDRTHRGWTTDSQVSHGIITDVVDVARNLFEVNWSLTSGLYSSEFGDSLELDPPPTLHEVDELAGACAKAELWVVQGTLERLLVRVIDPELHDEITRRFWNQALSACRPIIDSRSAAMT